MSGQEWALLIISLPGKAPSTRMRIWRALKASGAAILRDGVYVLPASQSAANLLGSQADGVRTAGGSAYVLTVSAEDLGPTNELAALFDRHADLAQWIEEAEQLRDSLSGLKEAEARRKEAVLRRRLESIVEIDFFPTDAQARARATMSTLADDINRAFSPGEPQAQGGTLRRAAREDYQGKVWATRQNLWVDRVASAWLIRRFIDPHGTFLWLETLSDCPQSAVGFDFDAATFTHVGSFVTFQVLVYAFALEQDSSLARMGELVRYLDVGGAPVAEATGVVTLLSGAKHASTDDDQFLAAAAPLLDHLYQAFARDLATEQENKK